MSKEKGMSTVVYSLVVDPDNKVRRVYNVESVLVWQDSILISYYLRGELETLSLPMSEVLFFRYCMRGDHMTKYKYKVVVELQAGPDDTMVFDYTGVEYLTRQEAKRELRLAQCEVEHKNYILDAWIEKVEAE